MTLKIVLVGAGSREFGPATIRDILLSDALCAEDLEIALMDVSEAELPATQQYAEAVAQRLGRHPRITQTTNLDEALDGADFVVTAIEIKRYYYWAQDFHVPRQHGFRQIYGENGGPGGLFHALRNMGPSLEIARAMERRCPDAWLLNYTNPLTKLCEALTRLSSVRVVGLCHGVFAGMQQLCDFLDLPLRDLEARACGLNHFTWFQTIRHRPTGDDLYPRLREREREAHWLAEWDEIALSRILLRTFGLYPSPGANHIGEYVRWAEEFLGSSLLQFFYDPADGHPWQTGAAPTWLYNLNDHPTDVPLFPDTSLEKVHVGRAERMAAGAEEIQPSGELAIPIMEGVFCGVAHDLDAVNVPNRDGLIPGLPDDAVVEVPATADGDGLHPHRMDPLPEGILALLRTQASINKLLVEAFAEESRNKLLQAVLLEPTAHSYRSAVNLVNEMCDLQSDVLPPLR